jgi:tetratricopeptide (TPR) repeat protein
LNIICKQSKWVNFGANRTEVFDFAKTIAECKYMLVLDADDILEGKFDKTHEMDVGNMLVKTDGLQHVHRRLFNTKFDWKYVGAVHEYPVTRGERAGTEKEEMITSARINHAGDGGSHDNEKQKSEEYLRLLESSDQNDSRTIFYTAQTLRGMGRLEEARRKYEQRLMMGGYKQEIVISMLSIARIQHALGQTESALTWYIKTYEADADRSEALNGIVTTSKQLDLFNLGLWAGKQLMGLEKTNVNAVNKLFYEGNKINEHVMMDIGLCAYYAVPSDTKTAKKTWKTIVNAGVDRTNTEQAKKNLAWIK